MKKQARASWVTEVLISGVFLIMVSLLPSTASAVPLCAAGTLQSYISLGSGGCLIEDKVFSDFSYSSQVTGSGILFLNNPSASQVSVLPLATPSNPGVRFSGNPAWGIDGASTSGSPNLFFDIKFQVTIAPGDLIKDEGLVLDNASTTFAPIRDDFVDVRISGAPLSFFGPGHVFVTGFPPPSGSEHRSENITFTPVQSVTAEIQALIEGGDIFSIQENFSEVVPEPTTVLLMASGLAGLAFRQRFLKTFV